MDNLWDPAQWDIFTGGDGTGTSGVGQSPLEVQGTLTTFIGGLSAAEQALLAATWTDPTYAGSMWTESVINTGEFKNYGIYGDIDFAITDRLNLIFGLRYSKDEKEFTWENPLAEMGADLNAERAALGVGGAIPTTTNFLSPLSMTGVGLVNNKVSASDEWDKITGRFVAQYQLTDDAMTFFNYSTGYTSGGFDSFVLNSSETPLEPEESTNLEWGIKGDFLEGRLRAQFSYFNMEIDNRQDSVTSADPTIPGFAAPIIISGDEEIDGWELSLTWLATETLQLGLVTTQRETDEQYQAYIDSNGNPAGGDKVSGESLDAYTITADWEPEIAFGHLNVHVDYVFEEQDFGPDSGDYLPIYESIENFGADKKTLNARVSWSSDDNQYMIALWGKNLLDEQYTGIPGGLSANDLGTPHTSVSAPLTWGIDARYNF